MRSAPARLLWAVNSSSERQLNGKTEAAATCSEPGRKVNIYVFCYVACCPWGPVLHMLSGDGFLEDKSVGCGKGKNKNKMALFKSSKAIVFPKAMHGHH